MAAAAASMLSNPAVQQMLVSGAMQMMQQRQQQRQPQPQQQPQEQQPVYAGVPAYAPVMPQMPQMGGGMMGGGMPGMMGGMPQMGGGMPGMMGGMPQMGGGMPGMMGGMPQMGGGMPGMMGGMPQMGGGMPGMMMGRGMMGGMTGSTRGHTGAPAPVNNVGERSDESDYDASLDFGSDLDSEFTSGSGSDLEVSLSGSIRDASLASTDSSDDDSMGAPVRTFTGIVPLRSQRPRHVSLSAIPELSSASSSEDGGAPSSPSDSDLSDDEAPPSLRARSLPTRRSNLARLVQQETGARDRRRDEDEDDEVSSQASLSSDGSNDFVVAFGGDDLPSDTLREEARHEEWKRLQARIEAKRRARRAARAHSERVERNKRRLERHAVAVKNGRAFVHADSYDPFFRQYSTHRHFPSATTQELTAAARRRAASKPVRDAGALNVVHLSESAEVADALDRILAEPPPPDYNAFALIAQFNDKVWQRVASRKAAPFAEIDDVATASPGVGKLSSEMARALFEPALSRPVQ
jgi:hypothetical protein